MRLRATFDQILNRRKGFLEEGLEVKMDKDEVASLVQKLLEGHQERVFQEMESIHDQLEVMACVPFPRSDWGFEAASIYPFCLGALRLSWDGIVGAAS